MKSLLVSMAAVGVLCGPLLGGEGPTVATNDGELVGAIDSATRVESYKGIPFAAPPVGDLRWREPQPVQPWSGVRDATKFGHSSIQRIHGDYLPWTREFLAQNEVNEDCLYLNVWTPQAEGRTPMPVVVFIHGGAFHEGSGEVPVYDGTHLAAKGLVVVTINYRLGVLGFFSHPELSAESPHHASGNYGLMDQIAALRWVKGNIAAFGGDPARVTVWGQSAGAASVGALLSSPLAKGLFQRAMADSGLGIGGGPMRGLKAAERMGVTFGASHKANSLEELRALPAAEFVGLDGFGLVVDGWVLRATPDSINLGGGGSDVPVITGSQANDGGLEHPAIESINEYWEFALRSFGAGAPRFMRLYPVADVDAVQDALKDAGRDRERVASFLWATEREATHKSRVYTYYFTRAIPWPQHPAFGAFHTGEIPYFFENLGVLDRPWEPVDRELSDTVSGYLKEFAKNGDPNRVNLPKWPAANVATQQTEQLGEDTRAITVADPEKYSFWAGQLRSSEGDGSRSHDRKTTLGPKPIKS